MGGQSVLSELFELRAKVSDLLSQNEEITAELNNLKMSHKDCIIEKLALKNDLNFKTNKL